MPLSKEYILALKSLNGVGSKKILKIGSFIENNNIIVSSFKDLIPILDELNIKVNKKTVKDDVLEKAIKSTERFIALNDAKGIGITTYYDDDFPSMLRKTINEEGKLDPPIILYYKGDLSISKLPGLAVIGTREVTDFGSKAGLYITQEFAKRGFCIVSGLAIGCDTVGHQGALSVGGKTIAFLAHGLDVIYPPKNTDLAQMIVDNGGLLLSEYPIGTSVNRYNLVARDRLQAGMSLATLVIQTGERGGTMHAANATLIAQKPLYTIKFQHPYQNFHEKSLGNALLVKKGAKYISGDSNIDSIKGEILGYESCPENLFDQI